nr:translation initiation factor IF-2-like [Chrysemys picta bellii]
MPLRSERSPDCSSSIWFLQEPSRVCSTDESRCNVLPLHNISPRSHPSPGKCSRYLEPQISSPEPGVSASAGPGPAAGRAAGLRTQGRAGPGGAARYQIPACGGASSTGGGCIPQIGIRPFSPRPNTKPLPPPGPAHPAAAAAAAAPSGPRRAPGSGQLAPPPRPAAASPSSRDRPAGPGPLLPPSPAGASRPCLPRAPAQGHPRPRQPPRPRPSLGQEIAVQPPGPRGLGLPAAPSPFRGTPARLAGRFRTSGPSSSAGRSAGGAPREAGPGPLALVLIPRPGRAWPPRRAASLQISPGQRLWLPAPPGQPVYY